MLVAGSTSKGLPPNMGKKERTKRKVKSCHKQPCNLFIFCIFVSRVLACGVRWNFKSYDVVLWLFYQDVIILCVCCTSVVTDILLTPFKTLLHDSDTLLAPVVVCPYLHPWKWASDQCSAGLSNVVLVFQPTKPPFLASGSFILVTAASYSRTLYDKHHWTIF